MNMIVDDKVNRILVVRVMFLDFLLRRYHKTLNGHVVSLLLAYIIFFLDFTRISTYFKQSGAKILPPKPSNVNLLEKLKKVDVTATEGMFVFVFVILLF